MDLADTLTRRARLMFWLNGLSFLAWQVGEGLTQSEQVPSGFQGAGFVASGMGFGLWLVSLILILAISWQARRAGLFDIMSDEWAKRARARAAELAFWVLSASTVIFMTLSNFGVDARLLLKLLTGLTASSFLIGYAWFDGQNEPDDDPDDA